MPEEKSYYVIDPEGKLTCGNMTEVAARFKGDL